MLKNQRFKIKPRTGHPRNSMFPGGDPPVPDQVTGVQITGTTSSSVSASWNSANGATSYNVYVNNSLHTSGISSTSATVGGLSSDTTYQISVAGQNSTGEGLRSSNMPATTQQIVSGARNRQLHPCPSDDPVNMPLGANAVLMTSSDPATSNMNTCLIHTGPGWGAPVFMATSSDPMHTVTLGWTDGHPQTSGVNSWIDSERGGSSIQFRVPSNANPPIPTSGGWGDRRLNSVFGNEVLETWKTIRDSPTELTTRKIVRNRLDRYSMGKNPNLPKIDGGSPYPNSNEASGGHANGNMVIAGLIRKHEIETDNPHIPHALLFNVRRASVITGYQQGDPSSPFYNLAFTFPAVASDGGYNLTYKYPSWTDHNGNFVDANAGVNSGSVRMGMRFALDPAVWTDTYINSSTSSLKVRALIRAARDYGVFIADETRDNCSQFKMDVTVSDDTLYEVWRGQGFWGSQLRRVAGRMTPGGSIVHVVEYSHWRQWADAGQGWGGGSPRVPYSPPLAPL